MKFLRIVLVVSAPVLLLATSVFAGFVPKFHRESFDWNGTNVVAYHFESPHAPIFQIRIVFDGTGAYFDSKSKAGISSMAFSLLKRGTTRHDEEAFATSLDLLAGGIDADVDRYDASVSLHGLDKNLDSILALAAEALLHPSPTNSTYGRILKSRLDTIRRIEDSAGELTSAVFSREVARDTPYAGPTYGRIETIKKLQFKEVLSRYGEMVGSNRIKILVIGGTDRSKVYDKVMVWLREVLDKRTVKFQAPPTPPVVSWPAPKRSRDTIIFVNRPGISQAHVMMGFPSIARGHADYELLTVAETALGGYFGSRLNIELREKSQLTYSASADLVSSEDWGVFKIAATTQVSRVGELIQKTTQILDEFIERGAIDSEFEATKKYILGSYPLSLKDDFSVASGEFEGVEFSKLPKDFMDQFVKKIEHAKNKDVLEAVRRHFRVENMITVVVGDGAKIRPILKASGLNVIERGAQEYF